MPRSKYIWTNTEDMSQVCEDFTYQIISGQITIDRQRAGMGKAVGSRVAGGGRQ